MNKIQFFLIVSVFLLQSCQGVKDALEGSRRSSSGDEFLVEKRNPLSLPPNFEDLPLPENSINEANNEIESEDDLQKIIDQSADDSSQDTTESGSLESLVIEEINRN